MTAKTIAATDFVRLHDGQNLCLLDVRTPAEIRNDALIPHIAIPLDQLDAKTFIAQREGLYSPDQPVYVICQSGKRAQLACEKLRKLIPEELIVVEGGMNAIRQAQGLTQTVKTPISIECQVRLAAGSLVFLSVLAGYFVHPIWFALTGSVGIGLIYAAVSDSCAMGMLISKAPWNR